ncbi:hypothetical protein ACHAXN_012494 [Cyclotella atomus]
MSNLIRDEEESTIGGLAEQPIITLNSSSHAPRSTLSTSTSDIVHVVEADVSLASPTVQNINKNGPRRSTRNRIAPLEFWRNERQVYGTHRESGMLGEAMGNMPVVIGVQRAAGVTYFQSGVQYTNEPDYISDDESAAATPRTSEVDDSSEDEVPITRYDNVSSAEATQNYTLARLVREAFGPPPDMNTKNVSRRRRHSVQCSLQSLPTEPTARKTDDTHESRPLFTKDNEDEVDNATVKFDQVKIWPSTDTESYSQRIKELEKENRRLTDCLKCPICYEVKENDMHLIAKCQHRICRECAKKLKGKCHICSCAVQKKKGWLTKIYY